ncbi:DNA gyrase subunit A [Novosphingobium sp. ST904]|uniref:DNA gyrase subunit A n=1 Tax=Novosphingobium sp. ST904 TaxID=1684385 RepID=UPI0006C87B90|nr:DNA gyrase subunit A [Novosphingobium sp. ST904]KPH63039.1 DNA gyrase subunit A [Novosphingobium sp. ST904]TCM32533.1 DNA gyrase subunit A [Novosphingobium sp. ST904]
MSDDTDINGPEHIGPEGEYTRIDIVDEMKTSYLDYAMSVIVSRALPDVRDGLKPVHRRILYACQEAGYVAGRPYRKSSRIVGDVMGKYHPHGDSAIYDALARMTQPWSMRLPLVDGQGNFGSMDPDPPAAMRYTEARLDKVANELLSDIDKNTVDFADNYDGSESEPTVLPARFPNLLVNGAGGIAVGMATNIPPHNLGEVVDGCLAMIDNPGITTEELIQIIPGPDFPTAPLILGQGGARNAYLTGRGSVIMRCRHEIEEGRGDRRSIVLTSIPYQVGKSNLVEKIAEAAKDKRIEGISDIRDESNREGMRVVVELKRDATPGVVLNQIWRNTPAQSNFAANMLAIRGGRPEVFNLRDIIHAFIQFREEVITRRTKFELNKARDRAHILLGLVVAVSNLDEVVVMIRSAPNPAEARARLLAKEWPIGDIAPYIRLVEAIEPDAEQDGGSYRLSEVQVKAILDLRLHRLTALGRDEIGDELKILAAAIEEYLSILADRVKLYGVMRGELTAVRELYATPRVSQITGAADGIEDEDLIEREEMVVTVTMDGYIKRTPLSTFRAQARGGKGRAGMSTKDEDVVTTMFVTSTHNPVLFFSTAGKVYRLKVYKLPEGGPTTRGRPIVNLLPSLDKDETIQTVLPLPEDEKEWSKLSVVFATAKGNVRRNSMDAFANIPSNGKFAMKFEPDADGTPNDDRLIGVALLAHSDDVLLASRQGKAIRFAGELVREFASRTSTGVKAMTLKDGDEVISLSILHRVGMKDQDERDAYLRFAPWKGDKDGENPIDEERFAYLAEKEQFILTVCANGYGKMSSAYEYRRTGRGGQGITNIDNIGRNGLVVASFPATRADQLMLVTDQAKLIRLPLESLRVIGRGSAGVRLFNVSGDEHVVSAVRLDEPAEEEVLEGEAPSADGAAAAQTAPDATEGDTPQADTAEDGDSSENEE